MKVMICLRIAFLAVLSVGAASAAVINSSPIGSLTTFQDTNTGRIWVDLDNYFGLSYLDMKADVESKGFIVADLAAVEQLLNSLPLTGGEWPTYAAIMGRAPNRDLIWGAYLPEISNVSWAWSFQNDGVWSFEDDTGFGLDVVPNAGGPDADMNIWAYTENGAGAVPEPSPLGLAGSAVMAMLALRLRRR